MSRRWLPFLLLSACLLTSGAAVVGCRVDADDDDDDVDVKVDTEGRNKGLEVDTD